MQESVVLVLGDLRERERCAFRRGAVADAGYFRGRAKQEEKVRRR